MKVASSVPVRSLGLVPYERCLADMKAFAREGDGEALWLVQHPPVYTLGQGAREVSVANGIPVVRSDRGGEVTYHGPGQAVLYALLDLAERGIRVKRFVWLLEQAVLDVLRKGERRPGAPGVYVDGAKVAALGIRVVRGRAYHGLALNVDMDLSPFSAIDPCGYPGLRVTQAKDLGFSKSVSEMGEALAGALIDRLGHE